MPPLRVICLSLLAVLVTACGGGATSGGPGYTEITFVSSATGSRYTLDAEQTTFLNKHLVPSTAFGDAPASGRLTGTLVDDGDTFPCRLQVAKHSSHPVFLTVVHKGKMTRYELASPDALSFFNTIHRNVR